MSKKYSKSNKTKRTAKTIALILVTALLGAGLATGIGVASNGFENMKPTEWFADEVNSDNLIKVDDTYIVTQDTNRGVKIKVNEDNGEIKLTGTATSAHQVTVQKVTLDPGKYQISGMENVNVDECYLGVLVDGVTYKAGVADNDTFTIGSETEVSVYISWVDEHSFGLFGTKILPELVAVTETAE